MLPWMRIWEQVWLSDRYHSIIEEIIRAPGCHISHFQRAIQEMRSQTNGSCLFITILQNELNAKLLLSGWALAFSASHPSFEWIIAQMLHALHIHGTDQNIATPTHWTMFPDQITTPSTDMAVSADRPKSRNAELCPVSTRISRIPLAVRLQSRE
jgi:hypothetical protein